MIIKRREAHIFLQCPLENMSVVPVVILKDELAPPAWHQSLGDAIGELHLQARVEPADRIQGPFLSPVSFPYREIVFHATDNDGNFFEVRREQRYRYGRNPRVLVTRIRFPNAAHDPLTAPLECRQCASLTEAAREMQSGLRVLDNLPVNGIRVLQRQAIDAQGRRPRWFVRRMARTMSEDEARDLRQWCIGELERLKKISHDRIPATFTPSRHWLAGFMDTDGSWNIHSSDRRLRPFVCQRSRPVTDVFHRHFGFGTVHGPRIARRPDGTPGLSFKWGVTSHARGIRTLRSLGPHAVSKSEQAALLLGAVDAGDAPGSDAWDRTARIVVGLQGLQGRRREAEEEENTAFLDGFLATLFRAPFRAPRHFDDDLVGGGGVDEDDDHFDDASADSDDDEE